LIWLNTQFSQLCSQAIGSLAFFFGSLVFFFGSLAFFFGSLAFLLN
jgi:hypothetical protein